MTILRTEGLTRRFGQLTAVDGLDIEIEAGEIFGLLGPNGAGKTTVIKMLTTLLRPTKGTAFVRGFDIVKQASRVRRVIGYVPQLLSADGTLTGEENLTIFAKLYDIPRAERAGRIAEALEMTGLHDSARRLVRTYSGGMIRRLEVAGSMLHRPAVLFLDEPTVGLDPTARRTVWEHIEHLRNLYGTTILLTTHSMEEADEHCGRVAIMHLGHTVAMGTPGELKASTRKETAREGADAADQPISGEVSLDDVFAHYTGAALESGGSYRDTSRTRRTARRLG